jgi:hypothetical protein
VRLGDIGILGRLTVGRWNSLDRVYCSRLSSLFLQNLREIPYYGAALVCVSIFRLPSIDSPIQLIWPSINNFPTCLNMSPTKTPQRVSFAYLTPNNLGVVRKLNSVLFPIKYSEKFYHDILQPDVEDFCQLSKFHHAFTPHELHNLGNTHRTSDSHHSDLSTVYYNDVPVGTFCSKIEAENGRISLYLMTMGILAVSCTPLCPTQSCIGSVLSLTKYIFRRPVKSHIAQGASDPRASRISCHRSQGGPPHNRSIEYTYTSRYPTNPRSDFTRRMDSRWLQCMRDITRR